MGWTSYYPTHFTKRGAIDRKAECDAYFMEGLNRGNFLVLKSAMKGSTYYATVKSMVRYAGKDENGKDIYEPISDGKVCGYVFITAVEKGEFFYKDMSEFSGPAQCDCPKSIINLLSETDDEWALEWRRRCLEQAAKPKLSSLPVGTVIEWTICNETYRAVKSAPAYQFKRPFWLKTDGTAYIPSKRIADNWKVVEA